jgi:transglutaminase-like putative cysteine protease
VFVAITFTLAFSLLVKASDLEKANSLELKGQFKEAAALLETQIKASSGDEKKKLEFELDRLDRIRKDFNLTKEELFGEVKGAVSGLTREEFEKWIAEGRFDSREIDGKRYYVGTSVSNLFFRHPELDSRRTPPKQRAAQDKAHYEACVEIKKAALAEGKPYVLPKRFHVEMKVSAKPNAAPAGETINAWLPIARSYPFQTDIHFLSSTPPAKHIDGADSPVRAVYTEAKAAGNKPTEFKLDYDFTRSGVFFAVDPKQVKPCPDDTLLRPFLKEAPHVVFTPEIRALSDKIAAGETNPYLKAKKFYDWIADNIQYSYAIEYSTIRNISDYCRSHGYGDCGQEALLFITLCRLNGIPARWQTGWDTTPNATTIHDWSEIYIAPYGWMPVDPYMGIYAMQYAKTLSPEQKRDVRDFFFGGQDWYRIAANSDHNQTLTPPKKSMRSDDVDFQRGELEWGDHNIYFDKYSWKLSFKEIKEAAKNE